MKQYQVMVKNSPMAIVGVPMWKDVSFATREEAEAAVARAKKEIEETWASPMPDKNGRTTIPVWVESFDV